MNILHVYKTYYPETQGGLEEVIRQICHFASDQSDVTSEVFTLARNPDPPILRRPEATVYRAKQHGEIASCGFTLTGHRLFRDLSRKASIIHYHFPWPFADLLHELAPAETPAIVTYHSDIVRQQALARLYRPLMDRFLSTMDRIICTSPNYFATSRVLSRHESKVNIVPIGLDENTYPSVDSCPVNRVREKYGSGFFLFVGVLRYYKGLHILLEAAVDASYEIVIVGSGPTEAELKAIANEMRLSNVTFTGRVDDATKVALFSLCRCVVFPSYLRAEAFGVTLLEGAMYSKPLISTEVGSGTSHVNVHGETGFVVEPGSATALRQAMDAIYSDPGAAKAMGQRARLRYESNFTGSSMGARYLAIYRDLGCQLS